VASTGIAHENYGYQQGYFNLREVPGLRRIQYTHDSQMIPNDRYLRQSFLKVLTDDGVKGMCTTTMTRRCTT